MNAGVRVPSFIEGLTGITDAMVRAAPPASRVMREVADFVGDLPLVAHNASFDCRFWDAELHRIDRRRRQQFACSMLLSRRVFPQAPSHKLSALVQFARLPVAGRYHRAMADAEMAASLLLRMEDELRQRFHLRDISHALLCEVQSVQRHRLAHCLERHSRKEAMAPG
jgi:DNA polymerase-3 subunit epsilon